VNLYLIDGNSYVYRAYYAIKVLSNSKGFPTNAVYGFTNMLLKIIREKRPDAVVVAFDSPVPTARHRMYEAYKAQRPETPGDLVLQLPYIRKMVSAFQIPIFELPGYEADDIIATIARKAASEGTDVFIVTGDKDMLQLVNDRIKMYDPMKDRIFDSAAVKERYGVEPARIPEFMALTGDAVDNIPGIKGVGEKTAKELLIQFESIEDLLQNHQRIKKDRVRALVAENADSVRLSEKLAILDPSVPVDMNMDEFRLRDPDWLSLHSLLKELEFGSLMKLIPSQETRKTECETVLSSEVLAGVLRSIRDECAFDTETTGRNPITARLVGLSLSAGKSEAYYVPVSHAYPGVPVQIDKGEASRMLSPVLEDEKIAKTGHNLKYDMIILAGEGVSMKGRLYDTMIASYLLNPNKPNHSLEEVALERLSYRKKTFMEVLGKRKSFAEVPMEKAAPYACDDASLVFELRGLLFDELRENGLEDLYHTVEMPLIPVLADIEMTGIKVDSDKLLAISKELERELEGIQRRIYFLAGEEFNINSPKQLSNILFHSLGFQPGKKTKTGFSTEMGVLEELARVHELPREILNYRSMSKLKSTYIDVLPGLINPQTGRVHTSFNQTVTATGRLSSSEPNLQNIPIRGEWGRRIRATFIAEGDNFLLSADYSQVELRVLAHLSNDEGLIEAFRSNLDVHTRTASELFGVTAEQVSPDMRRIAKTVNFGVIYGISPFGLSETLSISREEAKQYIGQYFARHPGVQRYIEENLREAKKNGYVTTLFGRRRAVPELGSRNMTVRQQGERFAINSPIQGTAADIIKIAMITIGRKLREGGMSTKMILQVHDELLFEVPPLEIETAREIVRSGMEGVLQLSAPLRVDIHHGKNWAEAH
jgi:DNA polymerase I